MKKTLIPFIFLLGVLFQSCTGPRGRDGLPGIDGQDGVDGTALVGQTFEVEKVNFTAANGYSLLVTYTDAKLIDVRESDAVFVYILWEVTDSGSPVWRLLPQPIDMPKGVVYNFDYTPGDFSVFIDAPSDALKASLAAEYTQNQTFRAVVVPSDFTARKGGSAVDFKDYEAVKKYFNLDESKITKLTVN